MTSMTRGLAALLSACLLLAASASSALAAGYDTPILYSARHMGMGGTAIGYVNDPSAVFHNPAGFAHVKKAATLLDISFLTGHIQAVPSDKWEGYNDGVNGGVTSEPVVAPAFLVGGAYRGLSWRLKSLLTSILGGIVAGTMYWLLDAQSINIPWLGQYELGYVYLGIAFITFFAGTTAVAVTDGLDGLLGGLAAVAFAAYGIIAFGQGQDFLAVFCFTVVGALLGFLWYNAHPAQVFMGDTGALPLGAALATVGLMTGHWLLLPVIGVVFVAEAASDVLQVAYFKATGGRRLFRKAPLHHHLELLGWSEPQVVMRLYLFGIAGAMVGVALALSV